MKMAQKLSLFLTFVVILAISVVVLLDRALYDCDIENTTEALFMQISLQVETVMDTTINNLDAIAKTPLYSAVMQEELRSGDILSEESLAKLWQATEIFNPDERLRYVIAIYNHDGQVAYSSASAQTSYLIKRYYTQWYEAAEKENGGICITGLQSEDESFCCTASRILKSLPRMEEVGLISISVPKSVLNTACAQVENIRGGVAIVLDGEGNVLYTSSPDVSARTLEEFLSDTQQSEKTYVNTDRFLGYYAGGRGGKYAVVVYTEKSELMARQRQIHAIMLLIAAAVCFLTVLLVLAVVNNTTRPLRRISGLMLRVQEGDWAVRFHARYEDEIGILGRNFNYMLESMEKMTGQLVAVSTSKKQAEIDALQGQINPHFMYNTLELFRMMAVEKDDFELADLICSFGKMLRYNITTMNETTTIAQELEYLKHFVAIYNARHTRRIMLHCDVPPELMGYPVIKLLLQPILENAVSHGLELSARPDGCVTIRMCREETLCLIDIQDNGLGISREKLQALRERICIRYAEARETAHIGLRNVNERIKLYYGEEYGLNVESREGEGTCVRITLPYTAAEEGGKQKCGT